jgi:hypothetical protein
MVAASLDDWDHYESQHWRAAAAWIREHPDDPEAGWLAEKIEFERQAFLAEERDVFGWAILVAEKVGRAAGDQGGLR